MEIQPFQIDVSESVLNALQQRLANTRFPDEMPGSGWAYGSNLDYMKELIDYWRTRYDWRAQERFLNTFHHYRATINGQRIHFIHERGKGTDPLPLVLTHGWPSSFYEMTKIIPLLTDPASHGGDPADAFDIIAPSLPGYGFSDPYTKPGRWRVADVWSRLMEGLGYVRYGASAGDVGAGVTSDLGRLYPENVVGIYITTDSEDPNPMPEKTQLTEAERDYLRRVEQWDAEEGGYSHIQGTRPQTLAYGLNDSPAGLAAWIVEKWRAWGNCGGDVDRHFSKDELLTTVMIYWVTETINSSIRAYYESRHHKAEWRIGKRVTVPTGIGLFGAGGDVHPPREWVERTFNVTHWHEPTRGGHFAAFEEPQLLAQELLAFFRPLR